MKESLIRMKDADNDEGLKAVAKATPKLQSVIDGLQVDLVERPTQPGRFCIRALSRRVKFIMLE